MTRPMISATVVLPIHKDWPLNVETKLISAIYQTMTTKVKPQLRFAMERRTTGWKKKPLIVGVYRRGTNEITLTVYPSKTAGNHLKWLWVTNGTRARAIYARKPGGSLAVQSYTPHTTSSGRYGGSGERWGEINFVPGVVEGYPGIKARNFETYIVKQEGKSIVNTMKIAIYNAVKD
jgi:hypothetical protein